MPIEHINKTDTLNDGRVKINEAIDEANTAKVVSGSAFDTSNTAKQIAQTAEDKADSTQTQLDTIVIEGDSSVEAAQARVPIEGVAYPTLKARLDAEQTQVTRQLADIVTVNVKMFGAKGDGINDDTEAIKDACAHLQSMNGGVLLFPDGIYNFTATKNDAVIFEFTDLNFFSLDGNNAIIKDTQTYERDVQELSRFFNFVRCKNINVNNGLKLESQTYDFDLNTVYSGIRWFSFEQGCENINVDVEVYGGVGVVRFIRGVADPISYKSKRIRVNIKASYVRYPYTGTWSGDHAEVYLQTFMCGRSFFIYGVKDVNIHVVGKNDGTSLIKSYEGLGCENISVYYEDLESNRPAGSNVGEKLSIHFGDQTPAIMKNINVHLNVANYAGGWGHTFTIDKFLDGGTIPDNIGRGHILDGLKLSGYSKGVSGVNHVSINRGIFTSPDIVRNVKFEDLNLSDAGGHNLNLNNSLNGVFLLKNVTMLHHNLSVGNQTGLIVYDNCKALNFTGTTTAISKHKYIDSEITDGTLQKYTDNEFVNTITPIGTINRHTSFSLYGFHTSSVVYTGSLVDPVNIFKLSNMSGAFRLRYFMNTDRPQTNPSTRQEKYGSKSWTMTVNNNGVAAIQTPIDDEFPERSKNNFTSPLEVVIINGDSSGFYIAVTCSEMSRDLSIGTFVIEVMSQNTEGYIKPMV